MPGYVPTSSHGHEPFCGRQHQEHQPRQSDRWKQNLILFCISLANSKMKHFFLHSPFVCLLLWMFFAKFSTGMWALFFLRLCKSSLYIKAIRLLPYPLQIFFSICRFLFKFCSFFSNTYLEVWGRQLLLSFLQLFLSLNRCSLLSVKCSLVFSSLVLGFLLFSCGNYLKFPKRI